MVGAGCQPSAAPPTPGPARLGPARSASCVPGGGPGCCARTPVQNPPATPERSKVLPLPGAGGCGSTAGSLAAVDTGDRGVGRHGGFWGRRRSVGRCHLITFRSRLPPVGFGRGPAPCGLPGGPGTAENGVETPSLSQPLYTGPLHNMPAPCYFPAKIHPREAQTGTGSCHRPCCPPALCPILCLAPQRPAAAPALTHSLHARRGKSPSRLLPKIAASFWLPLPVAGFPGGAPASSPQHGLPWGTAERNKLKLPARVSSVWGGFWRRCQ